MNDVKLFLESCQSLVLYALVALSLGVLAVSSVVALMKSVKMSAVNICRCGFPDVFFMSVMFVIGVSIGSVKVPGDPTNQVQQGQVSGEPLRRPGDWPPSQPSGLGVPLRSGGTQVQITGEDITNCWRVAEMREGCEIVGRDAFDAPQIHADWLMRGGFMDVMRIPAVGWSFPWRDGFLEGMTVFSDGGLRPSLRVPYFPMPFEVPLAVVPSFNWNLLPGGVSNVFWHAVSPSNSLIVTWENAPVNRDVNCITNFQAEFFSDGRFAYRYQDHAVDYAPVFPFDWDGDGLENSVDPEPMVYGGDSFGTGAEWLNANCGSVLSASLGTNDEITISWHTNVCEAAYFWLHFKVMRDGTCVVMDCDGESSLGDLFVIANSNQVCRVPLLKGPQYRLTANWPVEDLASEDADASIQHADRGSAGNAFLVRRNVFLGLGGGTAGGTLVSEPLVGATLSSVNGCCCGVSLDGVNYLWTCDGNCGCTGFGQLWRVTATWEGYSQSFDWQAQCRCQHENEGNPATWISFSVPSVVMRNGSPRMASLTYLPPNSAQGTASLRIVSGTNKIAIWEDEDMTTAFSIPSPWSAAQPFQRVFFIEGVALSARPGDVGFEFEVDLGSNSTVVARNLTVARVKFLHVQSSMQGTSVNPPPFDGEQMCPFSVTNSLTPDRHLMIPYFNVVRTNDFSVKDFAVDMSLELEPEETPTGDISCDWELVEAIPHMSGALVPGDGLAAHFVNPKNGGVYRFRGRCNGSLWTEANIVLPLAGAEVCGVFEHDFTLYEDVMTAIDAGKGRYERQGPLFGLKWFSNNGAADYRGRVDNVTSPTVWRYNQVDDISGFGAVATLYGVPVRMAKFGNFFAGYGTKRLGVWEISRWISQSIGTDNDVTAEMSWTAGNAVAEGSNVVETVAMLSTNMWSQSGMKVKTLWPNPAATDNHLERPGTVNYNRFFRSPQVIEDEVRRRRMLRPEQ
ncbi:MAG: hypothetical protein IKL96_02530 [Kiritimatiellae bacterium]|nr:hypothetical protein [Kiritimatiellia bacterium]